MIELLVALLVGSVLISVAVSSLSSVQTRYAVRSARDSFISLHARTRAHAIERGGRTDLLVFSAGDSVLILSGADTLERVHFQESMGVDIRMSGASLRLCMNARGFANTSCNSFNTVAKVGFAQGSEVQEVEILPLGQLVY